MKVAIYGAGSMGTIWGAYISRAGVEIDLINRNKAHVEAINGAVSAYGRKIGFPTPMNDKVVEIIHAIERGEKTFGWQNLKEF